MLSIDQGAQLCRLLADRSRLRLLLLLETEALSVAELTEITGLSQSRVSTHLGKLRGAGLVQDRRQGASAYYSAPEADPHDPAIPLWSALRTNLDASALASDQERAQEVIRRRQQGRSWAESVAGQMELHYSPGRTWEATIHALLPLLELGQVLDLAAGDGVLATLLAPRAAQITCVDMHAAVVMAGSQRLAGLPNASYVQGDMHQLAFAEQSFDQIFLTHALTYTNEPLTVLKEIRRVLRPAARAVIVTLARHEHAASVAAFDHANLGFTPTELKELLAGAGLRELSVAITSRELQPPYFQVITAIATR